MDKFKVVGGNRLNGKVKVSGAKNSCLPILAATLLASGEYLIDNTPNLMDVRTMLKLLKGMGINYEFQNNLL